MATREVEGSVWRKRNPAHGQSEKRTLRIPVHVHRYRAVVKFRIAPVHRAYSRRFSDYELLSIQKLVEENRDKFMEVWNDYFSD